MHTFRVYRDSNPNIAWLNIEEGNINLEEGIRFMYAFLDYDNTVLEKKLFIINGEDFADIGKSGKDTRIAIIELLLESTNTIIVQE